MKFIDNYLDSITMYRLVLLYLGLLSWITLMGSFFGFIPYNPISLILSAFFLLLISWAANYLFAYVFKVHSNFESVYITAFILFLIFPPVDNISDFIALGWAAILAESSKYILAINKKHFFNPAALAVVLTGLMLNQPANWWVGNIFLSPFVITGGILLIYKLRKFALVFSFIVVSVVAGLISGFLSGSDYLLLVKQLFLNSPMLFLAFVMLTEPLTLPPTKNLQIIYGTLIGLLSLPQARIFSFYFTPELALILGNIFSYIVSPKGKLVLELKEKIQISPDVYDFTFLSNQKINFIPGQFMEWTLKHPNPDNRGTRRFLTIASSPTEENLTIGVKFYEKSSTYKKALISMKPGDDIMAGMLAGEFTLPTDPNKKLVFIAGGIGITPFRSMIKYLIDTKQKRNVVLLFTCKTPEEIVYEEIFEQAQKELGIKTVYIVDSAGNFPNWQGKVGRIDEALIVAEVPDFKERFYYISGPPSMVSAFRGILNKMGVANPQIKTDYFPGFS